MPRLSRSLIRADGFEKLKAKLEAIEKARGIPPNRVYYLSIPPDAIRDSIMRLKAAGLIADEGEEFHARRVENRSSMSRGRASRSIRTLLENLGRSQIFRIVIHRQETVQNLMVLRSPTYFRTPVGREQCHHVQITVAEAGASAPRAMYYDGAARCATWCRSASCRRSRCSRWSRRIVNADSIREAKLNVLQALRPIQGEIAKSQTVRARYAAGVENGKPSSATWTKRASRVIRALKLRRAKTYRQLRCRACRFISARETDAEAREFDFQYNQGRAADSLQSRFGRCPPTCCRFASSGRRIFHSNVMAKQPGPISRAPGPDEISATKAPSAAALT